MKKLKYKEVKIGLFLMTSLIPVFSSCQADNFLEKEVEDDQLNLQFTGVVGGIDEIKTRANNDIYDISSSYYKCDFLVNLMEKAENDEEIITSRYKTGKYYIPSGYSGSLIPTADQIALNWYNRRTPHYFWGFSIPWDKDISLSENEISHGKDFSEGIKMPIYSTHITEALVASPSIMTESHWKTWESEDNDGEGEDNVESGDTDVSNRWKYGSWRNGRILEQFLGGLTGPFNYIDNGAFVQLRFRHLVPKVYIKSMSVVDNVSGAVSAGLKGEMTIYGLPNEVTFYPCPINADGTPAQPYVEIDPNWNYDQSSEVTFALTNNRQTYESEGHTGNYESNIFVDAFYFPPDVDFRKLSFKIEIYEFVNNNWRLSTSHGNHGAYYGDFKKISITRDGKSGYDNMSDPDEYYKLHAGEYMTLIINLYEKGEPSLRGTITSWNDFVGRDASQHVEDGIYSLEEMKEFSDLMSSSNLTDEKLGRREEFYDTHGAGTTADDPEGEYADYNPERKIIKLYDDIGTETAYNSNASSGTAASSTFKMTSTLNVADDYILDGQGHTIHFYSSTVSVGQVRDIYLRYYAVNNSTSPATYYDYIVYIDKKGNIFTVDPETFEETPTGQNISTKDANPIRISLATGEIS